MKIMVDLMIWGKVLINRQWFSICILCIQVPEQDAKNKIYFLIYQIFIEHLLCWDFPKAVDSWDTFRWHVDT